MCDDSINDDEASSAVVKKKEVPKFTDARKKGLVAAEIMRRIGVMYGHYG